MNFVTLSCPVCGGKLQITNDIDRFACAHCGNEHIVKRSGSIVSLSPVVEGLRRVEQGVDKTASELAIPRLEKEVAQLRNRLHEVTSKQWDGFKNSLGKAGMAFILFVVALVFASDVLACPAAAFLLLALWTFFAYRDYSIAKETEPTIKALKRKIYLKQSELQQHRKVVDE